MNPDFIEPNTMGWQMVKIMNRKIYYNCDRCYEIEV